LAQQLAPENWHNTNKKVAKMIMIITRLTIYIEDEVEDTKEDTKGDTKATMEDIREDIKNLARRDTMSASIKDAGQISIL
jgi:hypothetical protein